MSDADLNRILHKVMLDQELDNLGAPNEDHGAKLSPYGRLRRIAPELLADKRRLDWLEKNRANVVSLREKWDEETVLWWQVQKGKKSLSGHPEAMLRVAIDAAMREPNEKDQPRRGDAPQS